MEVDKESYFTQAVIYIHANAVKHKICADFMQYKWSSWHAVLSNRPTLLCRQELLDWFDGAERFIQLRKEQAAYYEESPIALED